MAYILIEPKILEEKNIKFFETIPDGRAIMETNVLKVLGSVKNVEFVATTKELNEMINYQKKHLQNKVDGDTVTVPEPEVPADSMEENPPLEGDVVPEVPQEQQPSGEEVEQSEATAVENGDEKNNESVKTE